MFDNSNDSDSGTDTAGTAGVDRGVFVTIEGIDGAGESTVAKALSACFTPTGTLGTDTDFLHPVNRAIDDVRDALADMRSSGEVVLPPGVTETAFPTDTDRGECARECIEKAADPTAGHVSPFLVQYRSAVDLQYETARTVDPALAQGELLIADRYTDSLRAYQSVRNSEAFDRPENARESVERSLGDWERTPDLTLWLDPNPVEARRRRSGGSPAPAGVDDRGFMRRVTNRYVDLWRDTDRVVRVKTNQPIGDVIRECAAQVAARLPTRATGLRRALFDDSPSAQAQAGITDALTDRTTDRTVPFEGSSRLNPTERPVPEGFETLRDRLRRERLSGLSVE
jgi:dTMP kinase